MEPNQLTSAHNHTIVALATAPVKSAIGVVRISGPDAISIVDKIFRGKQTLASTKTHRVRYGRLIDENENIIDECVATIFRAPHSFTGDDTIELSIHGSPWIASRVLNQLVANGAMPAKAGEFTMRAFMNGKVDLTQAEAIADIIASTSPASHSVAMNHLKGSLAKIIHELNGRLLNFASLLELELDFSEEDVQLADTQTLHKLAQEIRNHLDTLVESYSAGQALKNGLPIAIIGAPNAGKSTLLNTLAGEEKAIVSNIPGTTRDVIEQNIEIQGITCRFIDTAGLRDTADEIEMIGVEKAIKASQQATITILLVDGTQPIAQQLENIKSTIKESEQSVQLIVVNKCDLVNIHTIHTALPPQTIWISAKSGKGIDTLITEILRNIENRNLSTHNTYITNARHYGLLLRARKSLDRTLTAIDTLQPTDLIVEDLRETTRTLSEITGEITTPQILQNIFKNFCIGK